MSSQYDNLKIIGNPIYIRGLEVAENDFPNSMNWQDAYMSCQKLGNGWRLPSRKEADFLYKNKDKLSKMSGEAYWTSEEEKNLFAWNQLCNIVHGSGYQDRPLKIARLSVRAVRSK